MLCGNFLCKENIITWCIIGCLKIARSPVTMIILSHDIETSCVKHIYNFKPYSNILTGLINVLKDVPKRHQLEFQKMTIHIIHSKIYASHFRLIGLSFVLHNGQYQSANELSNGSYLQIPVCM